MSSFNSILADKLWRLVGVPHGPALIDVRNKDAFAADPRFVPSAMRRPHETVSSWAREFAGRATVAICEDGRGQSEGVAAWLRGCGAASAEVLAGGHEAWAHAGLPLVPEGKLPRRDPQGRTVWVTRSRPKIDRIACSWLIRRFVDPSAVFLGRQTPTGLILRLKRRAFSPPRLACRACIPMILNRPLRGWRSTTPSTAGRVTPATRRMIGRRTPRRNKRDRLTSDQNRLKPFRRRSDVEVHRRASRPARPWRGRSLSLRAPRSLKRALNGAGDRNGGCDLAAPK
jgi:rhodanese-related sulfurtransferase